MKLLIIILASTLSLSGYAQHCNYNASVSSFFATIADHPQSLEHEITVSRPTNSPGPNCGNYHVYFGQGMANSYQRKAFSGGNSISYNFYSDVNLSNILKDFGDAGSGEFLTGSVPLPNTPNSSSWYVGLPKLQDIFSTSPGVYTDVVPINIYAVRNNGDIEFQTARYMTVSISIPRYAQLSLVSEHSPFDPSATTYTMNFGTMSSNQELGADLRVRGNVGFGIYMSSANGSKLVKNTESVDYQIKVGNDNFRSLSPAGSLHYVGQSYTRTDIDGNRYNIRVRLGNVPSGLKGGQYQDIVTVTVQAW